MLLLETPSPIPDMNFTRIREQMNLPDWIWGDHNASPLRGLGRRHLTGDGHQLRLDDPLSDPRQVAEGLGIEAGMDA